MAQLAYVNAQKAHKMRSSFSMLMDDLAAEKRVRDAARASAERARHNHAKMRRTVREYETLAKSTAAAAAKQRAADIERARQRRADDIERARQLFAKANANADAAIRAGRMTAFEASRFEARMHRIGDELRRYEMAERVRAS